jgi:hypothetical protein
MITMGRPRWRRLRLLAACLLSLLLTVITVLLSELLMIPGLARNLVQNCAPNIGDLITLLLLLHLTQRPNRPDEDNGPAGHNKSTHSHDD